MLGNMSKDPRGDRLDVYLHGDLRDGEWNQVFATNSSALMHLTAPRGNGSCSIAVTMDSTLVDVGGRVDYAGHSFMLSGSGEDHNGFDAEFSRSFTMPDFIPDLCPNFHLADGGSPAAPSAKPVLAPIGPPLSARPTSPPTIAPSANPSLHPSVAPSRTPTVFYSAKPSAIPSIKPSAKPSIRPTAAPTTRKIY